MLASVCVPLIFLTLRGLVVFRSTVIFGISWGELRGRGNKDQIAQTQQPFQVWVSANQGEGLSSSALTCIHLQLLTPLLRLIRGAEACVNH